MVLSIIIISTVIITLLSFIGVITLGMKQKFLKKILLSIIALSAGVLIGDAFLHLIPQALEESNTTNVFLLVLGGFVLFFLIEKVLHWRHCHEGECPIHTFAYINLIGDFFHNFIDGVIIAASYLVSVPIGIATTLAIAVHEIPQEIGDFGVLIYAGFEKSKAIFMNFSIATTVIIGGLVGFFLSNFAENIVMIILPLAAGGFIYIAASDLIPEVKKDTTKMSIIHFLIFILGLAIMYALLFLE